MTNADRREILALAGAALFLPGRAAAMQRYRAPGVYVEEIPSGAPVIGRLPTDNAVLVTSMIPAGSALEIASLGDLTAQLAMPPLPELAAWVSAFFAEGGYRLTLFPSASGDRGGLLGGADPALGLAGLASAGALIGGAWPGGGKPLPVGLILVPEAAGLADTDPGGAAEVYGAAIKAAESLGALAIIDLPPVIGGEPFGTRDPVAEALAWRDRIGIRSPSGALYANQLAPGGGAALQPISPTAAGIMSRNDRTRGVWKAPAGLGASLASPVVPAWDDRENGVLNAGHVNVARTFPGAGTVLWGARTLAPMASEGIYIPVQRMRDHLRHSIRWGLQGLVFEDNTPATWASARAAVETLLADFFRQGALQGATPREAFFVRCGLGDTMSAADLAAGRMVVALGFAPIRPAEFLVETLVFEGFEPQP